MEELIKKHKNKVRYSKWGFVLAFIPLLGFFIFGLIPLILSFVVSLYKPLGYSFSNMNWMGLKNYTHVLTDEVFWKSVGNTFYAMLSIPINLSLSVIIATILTNKRMKGKGIFRTIYFLPYVCSVVAVSIMWRWAFDGEFGIINTLLSYIGIKGPDWLGNSKTLMPAMIMMSVWGGIGFNTIIFSAAMTNIDPSLYEAAEIDGAGSIARFYHITLPSISPVTFYLLSISIIGGLQDFARFQIMAPGGGPDNAGLTMVYYLYNAGFQEIITYGMGIATAVAWILTIIVVCITGANFKLSSKWVK
jgi:multiple sugar transport system permease protein